MGEGAADPTLPATRFASRCYNQAIAASAEHPNRPSLAAATASNQLVALATPYLAALLCLGGPQCLSLALFRADQALVAGSFATPALEEEVVVQSADRQTRAGSILAARLCYRYALNRVNH